MDLWFGTGAELNVAALNKAVVDGGFTPGSIALTITGTVKKNGQKYRLFTDGNKSEFVLSLNRSENTHHEDLLGRAAGSGSRVKIAGNVIPSTAEDTELAVTKVEILSK